MTETQERIWLHLKKTLMPNKVYSTYDLADQVAADLGVTRQEVLAVLDGMRGRP
jgi:hypothetical protein